MLAVGAGACAQQRHRRGLAKKVDAHYNHLHSLEAHYTERYQGMGMDRSETGTLTLLKPGRMRWAYDSPPGKVFILDGTNAISYTPGDAEATRFPEKRLDDLRSPLRFLLGHTELEKELQGLSVTLVNLDGQTGLHALGHAGGDGAARAVAGRDGRCSGRDSHAADRRDGRRNNHIYLLRDARERAGERRRLPVHSTRGSGGH